MDTSTPPAPPEIIEVTTLTVSCDGTDRLGGHPRVFLTLEGLDHVDCPYCDRRFVRKRGAKPGLAHA